MLEIIEGVFNEEESAIREGVERERLEGLGEGVAGGAVKRKGRRRG